MTKDRHLVQHHPCLISPVDTLMPNQPRCCDHICCHAIPNEENNVFRPLGLGKRSDQPFRCGRFSVVVCQCGGVCPWFIESDPSIDFGGDIDARRCLGIEGKQVLIPCEVPPLQQWVRHVEVLLCTRRSSCAFPSNREAEAGVWYTSVCL